MLLNSKNAKYLNALKLINENLNQSRQSENLENIARASTESCKIIYKIINQTNI